MLVSSFSTIHLITPAERNGLSTSPWYIGQVPIPEQIREGGDLIGSKEIAPTLVKVV